MHEAASCILCDKSILFRLKCKLYRKVVSCMIYESVFRVVSTMIYLHDYLQDEYSRYNNVKASTEDKLIIVLYI